MSYDNDNMPIDSDADEVAEETGLAIIPPKVTGHAVVLVGQFGPIYDEAKQLITDTQNIVISGMEDITGYNQVMGNADAKKAMRLRVDKDRKKIKEDAQKVVSAVDAYARPVVRALEASEDVDRLRLKVIDDEREIERQKQEKLLNDRYARRCDVLINKMGMSYDPVSQLFTLEDATITNDIVRLSGADVLERLVKERVLPIANRIKAEKAEREEALRQQQEREKQEEQERKRKQDATQTQLHQLVSDQEQLRLDRFKQLTDVGARLNAAQTMFMIGDRNVPCNSLHGWMPGEFAEMLEQARVQPAAGMSLAGAAQIRGGETRDSLHIDDILDQPTTEGRPEVLKSLEQQDLETTREAIRTCYQLEQAMVRMKTERGKHAATSIADKIKYLNQFFNGLANEFK